MSDLIQHQKLVDTGNRMLFCFSASKTATLSQTCSSSPHTALNDGTSAAHFCLPDLPKSGSDPAHQNKNELWLRFVASSVLFGSLFADIWPSASSFHAVCGPQKCVSAWLMLILGQFCDKDVIKTFTKCLYNMPISALEGIIK